MGVVGLCEVDLEDVNTKRLSLRIQLAQLMKERSLLLCNMSIEWCGRYGLGKVFRHGMPE